MTMRLRRNIITGLLLAAISILSSCEQLPMEQSGTINPSLFPKNEEDALSLVVGCYEPFQSNLYNGLFTTNADGYQIMGDVTTDLGWCNWIWYDDFWYQAIMLAIKPDNEKITLHYKWVRKISEYTLVQDMLENMDNISPEKKSRYIAEVKCAKGFIGYLLYNWFGPVPIATLEQLQDPKSTTPLPRATEEEMVDFIETNLEDAVEALDYKYPGEFGRFNKGVANMVLLKLYMLINDWDSAEKTGRELMKTEYGYGLMSEYADIFTMENQRNKEVIFSVGNDTKNANKWYPHVLPQQYPTQNTAYVRWNGYRVPWSFCDKFDPEDKRLKVLIIDYVGINGVRYWKGNPGVNANGGLDNGGIPLKYGEDPQSTGEDSSIDWIVYRYADAITLTAEAIVRNGNAVTQEALDILNSIRSRAGLNPGYELSRYGSSGVEGFLDDILLERGKELWWEGCRREDLIRHGKYITAAKETPEKMSETAEDYMVRMPLPQSVINEGKGIVKQNTGY